MDIHLTFKAKVNNSYESESASSGSSLSDNNDYLNLDIDSMNLPLLLKPSTETETPSQRNKKPCTETTPVYMSSQESPFRGFSESPFEKLKMRLSAAESEKGKKTASHDMCKKTTEQIYDTIITEDSCNAVDIALKSQEDQNEEYKCSSNDLIAQVTAELSFNGKIEVLKDEDVSILQNTRLHENITVIPVENLEFSQSFIVRDYKTEGSPDLFADEEDENEADNDISKKNDHPDTSANRSFNCPTESSFADEQTVDCTTQFLDLKQRLLQDNCKRERELLKRTRKFLSGVPPPPSLTAPQSDLVQMIISRKHDILNFFKTKPTVLESSEEVEKLYSTSLFKPTHTFDDVRKMPWRDILGARYHGLSYNLNKASESNEYLGLSVVERFVGGETNSSYRRSPSSAKKRNARLKMLTQSPGNRLSHLAKRRAVFSSAHLATTSQKSANSLGPQIVMDKKKSKHRRKATPKRKTPGSRKKTRKTPSSSARKRLFRCEANKPGPSRETSKRALFQSPAGFLERSHNIPKAQIKPEIATRVEKSKRALFSPDINGEYSSRQLDTLSAVSSQPFESLLKRKRRDSNNVDVDELSAHSSKLMRLGENLTPRALKIKSQSFCIGAGPSSTSSLLMASSKSQAGQHSISSRQISGLNSMGSSIDLSTAISSSSLTSGYGGSAISLNEKKLQRAHSEMTATSNGLTQNQRKKLLWAVSQALQEKKITTNHESFKQYASVLARAVRRIFLEYYQRTSTSTSETMLRLAKKYVYYVISGKSSDEVYLHVKGQLDESKRISASRLTGYIGPEEYKSLKKNQQRLSQSSIASSLSFHSSMQNLFSNENTIDILSNMISSTSSQQLSLNSNSQVVSVSQDIKIMETTKSASKQRPIEHNPSQQNSSSKSNLGSLALRENSGQKKFKGKDQRNVSPYAKNSGLKATSFNNSMHSSSAKAKRQILFDS